MSLKTIQQAYADAIYAAQNTDLASLIRESDTFSKTARIAVYRNNTLGTLKSALRETYPVCLALVDERYFDQLAAHHVKQHPSEQRNLDEYGASFTSTLTECVNNRPELASHGYLPDVARLEWLVHCIYFVSNRMAFDFERFARLGPEQQSRVVFTLQADVALLQSRYPVDQIWRYHQLRATKRDDQQNSADWSPGPGKPSVGGDDGHYCFMIQRPHWKTGIERIDPAVYQLLKCIHSATPLNEMTQALSASRWDIAKLIERGLISGFESRDFTSDRSKRNVAGTSHLASRGPGETDQ